MTDPKPIVVLGSINIDLVVRAHRAPAGGETLPGEAFLTIPGGKGANQAVAASRLGGKAFMVGRVGGDGFGGQMAKTLEEQGVDTTFLRRDPAESTGVALIVVEASGENRIIVVPGANGRVDKSDVEAAADLIRTAGLLVMQFEVSLETVLFAAKMAQQQGVPILLNPAPPYAVADELLQCVTYLVLNEHEAELISGLKVDSPRSAETAARSLVAKGARVVIITLGGQGLVMLDGAQAATLPAHTVKVVDSTAAGDAFIGAFSVALLEGGGLEEAARFANAAGALTVTRLGAQTSIPTRKEVLDFLQA